MALRRTTTSLLVSHRLLFKSDIFLIFTAVKYTVYSPGYIFLNLPSFLTTFTPYLHTPVLLFVLYFSLNILPF